MICQNCGKREATEIWSTCGVCFARGYYERWCDVCVARMQLEHAEAMAAALDERRAALDAALAQEGGAEEESDAD